MKSFSVGLACIAMTAVARPHAAAFSIVPRPRCAFAVPTWSHTALFMSETDQSNGYDFIVVGLGYAGAIMTARLAERNPDAKILAIEYGGPVQAKTGGASTKEVAIEMTASAFQNEGAKHTGGSKYDPNSPLCMADVPGNYNNVAFRPLSVGYHLEEFPACFQGTGLGGNGVYNGALFQEPAHWWLNDKIHNDIFVNSTMQKEGKQTSDVLQPYFDLVREELKDAIKSSPSMDGVHYNHGLYDLVKPYLETAKFEEVAADTPQLEKAGRRFFTVPTVNALEGLRTGPSAWLQKFMNERGDVRKDTFPGLTVMMYTEVLRVLLDPDNSVLGVDVIEVSGARRGGLQPPPNNTFSILVKHGGKVILSCNALPTNRILYRSGVGPEVLRNYVMPSRAEPFKVDNEAIGTTIHEHVTTSLGFKYTGEDKPQPNSVHFDPADYNGNSDHLANYARNRSGPYCQFGPVVASHFVADLDRLKSLPKDYQNNGLNDSEVTTELFYNPFGAGPYPPRSNRALNPYNGPGTFTVYVMLLRPEMRGFFRLADDGKDTAIYVQCYMNEDPGRIDDPDPTPEQLKKLELPNYRELAKNDIATMTASVHEVIEITKNAPDIELILGPGDKNSKFLKAKVSEDHHISIADLDPSKIDHVKAYVTFFDSASCVNGEYLAITHLEENHYHSSAPLARNLDVFGQELGNRKDTYGVDPDTCEVKGTKGLCVVDSGIFPKVVYCHPIGTVMAVAEWAADQISPAK